MSEPEPTETTPEGDLQFDQAEFTVPVAVAPMSCAICHRTIPDVYFELSNHVLCRECRLRLDMKPTRGRRLARFLQAGVFGLGAAAAGFAIYFGVAKVTGMEIGLVSILVGFMVGAAVQKGSGMTGGWAYQTLAVFLTYSAIAASYSTRVMPELIKNLREKQVEVVATAPNEKPGPSDDADASRNAKVAPQQVRAEAPDGKAARVGLAILKLLILGVVIVGFAYAIPIIAGFSSPMGFLIIGFALWEAWKLTRRTPLMINGPYQVGEVVAHG